MSDGYVKYLQQLLSKNQIQFVSQSQFVKGQEKTQLQFVPGPLKTNLKPDLAGSLISRYSRQMLLRQIGYTGQVSIINSKIALIGAGGIGCPLGLYLAGAGVGTLGLFDSDVVQITNLHRQVGHSSLTLNCLKTDSLESKMLQLNPNVKINKHQFVTKQTLSQLDQYDLVIDGSDNPKCRYLVNDYLMSKNKKYLSGACVGWEGQVTCYGGQSACYRCIWGDDQVSMGGCSTIGVVGTLPGLVAMVLATEAIKLVLKKQSSLEGELLTYQAKGCTFRKMKLRKRKLQCISCGENKMKIQQYDYDRYAGCQSSSSTLPVVPNIQWSDFITKTRECKQYVHIDVRPQGHFNIINFQNSKNIPLNVLSQMDDKNLLEIIKAKETPVFISCKVGINSKKACDLLLKKGYQNVYNIDGGIDKYGKLFDSNLVKL